MKKNVVIVVLGLCVLFLATRIVRIENQRYGLMVGMCPSKLGPSLPPDLECLKSIETRTRWVWHLYYALTD